MFIFAVFLPFIILFILSLFFKLAETDMIDSIEDRFESSFLSYHTDFDAVILTILFFTICLAVNVLAFFCF